MKKGLTWHPQNLQQSSPVLLWHHQILQCVQESYLHLPSPFPIWPTLHLSEKHLMLCGTTDWFRTEKGVLQGCLLSPCLFNLYAEHFMRNAGLDELQAGIKIARRNINNLSYAYNTTLKAESEEELKNLL